MDINPQLAITILGLVGTGGVAWGAVKMGLNGTRARVVKIEEKAIAHEKTLSEHSAADHVHQLVVVERLVRNETQLESAHARLKSIESKIDTLLRASK